MAREQFYYSYKEEPLVQTKYTPQQLPRGGERRKSHAVEHTIKVRPKADKKPHGSFRGRVRKPKILGKPEVSKKACQGKSQKEEEKKKSYTFPE